MSTGSGTGQWTRDTTPAAVLERVDEPVFALDSQWRFTYLNRAAATVLEREPSTLLGATLWAEFPDLADSPAHEAYHEALETQEPQCFEMAAGRCGAWYAGRVYPSTDGVTVSFREVTEQRRELQELRESRQLFDSVFSDTTDALVVADGDRRVTAFNPAAERLFACEAADVVGEPTATLYADGAASAPRTDDRTSEEASQRLETHRVEYERADGTTFEGETVWTPLARRGEAPFAFFSAIRDVTNRVEYERDIEELNRVLKRFHEIATDESKPVATQVTAVLGLATDYFGLETGTVTEIDGEEYTLRHVVAPDGRPAEGTTRPLESSLYERIYTGDGPLTFHDGGRAEDVPPGVGACLGMAVHVDGKRYGTVSFTSPAPRADAFSESESTFVRLIAQWVGKELSRRQNRERARGERGRLRQIIDTLPQLVFAKDESGTFILANEAVAEAYGTTVEELEGATDADFADSEAEVEQFRADDLAVIRSGELKYIPEESLTTADGAEKILSTRKIPFDPVDSPGNAVLGVSTDVTELKEREAELELQAAAMEAAMDGISILNPDSEYIYMNAAHAAVFDHDPADLIGRSWSHLYADPEIKRIESDVMPELAREGQWRGETVGLRRDGTPVDQEITLSLLDDGTLICTNRDITDRKRLEQSLRESERSLRELTDTAADMDRSFAEKLRAILELGCTRLDLPFGFLNRIEGETQRVVEAVGTHPELQRGNTAPLEQTYCRRTIEQEGVLDVPDAVDEGWGDDPAYDAFGLGCYVGGQVMPEGELYGTLCFADSQGRPHQFDESERAFVELLVQWVSYELAGEAVETKLRDLNATAQRLLRADGTEEIAAIALESARTVLDLAMTGVWWHDDDTETLEPAGMTATITDLIETQPVFEAGNSLAWEAFESREIAVYDDLQAVAERHNDDTPLQSEVIAPLGDRGVLISASLQPRAFSETDLGLLEILAATVETALQRAEREQVLRETRQRLEQSNQELEQFAYAASHDLQEPLRTVSSYLTLLERRHSDALSGDAGELLAFAVDGADRMREMIRALLEYSRVDTRGGTCEPTEMADVFDTVVQHLDLRIEEREATVTTPATAGRVFGDRNQLVQLFQNLVDNGIKYSESEPRVDITATRRGDHIEYAVADDGIGMAPGQTAEIFELFQRLHTREEFEGTGIGLSVCRKIVERHAGDIRVESSPGDGSTFVVTLPAAGENRD